MHISLAFIRRPVDLSVSRMFCVVPGIRLPESLRFPEYVLPVPSNRLPETLDIHVHHSLLRFSIPWFFLNRLFVELCNQFKNPYLSR